MNETARLAALFRQACDGEPGREDAWHGPSLEKLLQGVGAAQAASRRPRSGGHSIWELVLHIAVWDEICARRLEGEVIHATTGSPEDWPEVGDTTESRWQEARTRLFRAQAALARLVESLGEERLAEPVPGWDWPNYLMIHGTLHHDVYHAGQIALLKRDL